MGPRMTNTTTTGGGSTLLPTAMSQILTTPQASAGIEVNIANNTVGVSTTTGAGIANFLNSSANTNNG